MNNISEQVLQATEIIVNQKISELKYDKTIQAKIFSIVNLDTGEYKVRHSGDVFSAFASNVNRSYKVGENVYVQIPEGDMSNKKIITGPITNTSLSYSQLTTLQNSIFEISPEFNQLYGGDIYSKNTIGVIAGAPLDSENGRCYIYKGPDTFQSNGYHGLFQQYANNYELIRIQGSFLTQFYEVHDKGNYGIEVEFYTKDDQIVSYKLDLNSFNGDPYSLSSYSPQYAVIKVQKNYLLGLKSISLFEEQFEYDRNIYTEDLEPNTTIPNIFVKDISLQYVDRKDLSDTTYYLMIAAPRGVAITNTVNKLELVGRLIHQGKDILDNKYKCQWFKRDLGVMIGDERYNKTAGFGWAPLPQTENTLTLDDIKHQARYKLLVDYNNIMLSAEIEVFNQTSGYNYAIQQRTDGDDISLLLDNKVNDDVLLGNWYMSYPDGSYSSLADGKLKNSVSVSPYLKYSSVIFYCEVVISGEVVGTLEHTIINSESDSDLTISYGGEDTFRYDANGDIAIEDSEKERTLQVSLVWKEGYGTGYTVEWVMRNEEDNKEILVSKDRLNPTKPLKSMISQLWVDNYNILHYNIKQKYKVNFQNNTLIVKIKTIAGQTYLFQKEILFLKDGDQGTNGTTYVIAVRPCDGDGNKLSGFHSLKYPWRDSLRLKCYVYKDGESINYNGNYDIAYKWEGVGIQFLSTITDRVSVTGIGTINWNNSSTCQFYVKVQVSIADRINSRKTEVYASYPIDVVVGNVLTDQVDISKIPSYVKYTSSGITPQTYSNNVECFYQENLIAKDKVISLNTNILQLEERDDLQYIKPASSFIFENIQQSNESNIGILRFDLGSGMYIIHPIVMYLDTYGNEAINGWDGTALDTGNGAYVFAPQVGAGEKDSANRFTGVVMGKDSGQKLIGLYGYQAGTATFGLLQNGTAFFGARSGGGQINIDGRSATIYGGNGGDSSSGMTIRLADTGASGTTKAIKVGGGVFSVDYNGKLVATSADILGKIYAQEGQIGCDSRKRGGWTITSNKLYSGSGNKTVALDSSDSVFAIWAGKTEGGSAYVAGIDGAGEITSPAPFIVTNDGFLYATNAKIKGNIEAKSGKIANWLIQNNHLQSASGNVGMASSGNAAFWAGASLNRDSTSIPDNETDTKFLVTNSGKLYCASAQVSGNITARSGKIGNWIIRNGRLENELGSVYLSPDRIYGNIIEGGSISIGSGFNVDTFGSLTATMGSIGGWIIGTHSLKSMSGNVELRANSTQPIHTIWGDIGMVSGSDDNGATVNFGMDSTTGAGNQSIILKSGRNILLRSTGLYVTAPASAQHGIYARFA